MKLKKVAALGLATAMAFSVTACSSSKPAETTAAEAGAENKEVSGDQMIAMITDSGDITDESFNQITWETCVA